MEVGISLVLEVSASDNGNKDQNNGEGDWNDNHVWVFFLFKLDHLWALLDNNRRVLNLSLLLSFNRDSDVVVLNRLFNLN